MSRHSFWKHFLLTTALIVLFDSVAGHAAEQSGMVESGKVPIRFSSVTLYSAGSSINAASVNLGSAQADAKGAFSIAFTAPTDPNTILYLIAEGGIPGRGPKRTSPSSDAIRLATVLGPGAIAAGVVINERTTVATAYALAQFLSGDRIAGKSPGLQNAAATTMNLVEPVTGDVGTVLGSAPNGLRTTSMRAFNSLANMLAACVDAKTSLPCTTLFALASTPSGDVPEDTLQAALNIAHNPWKNPTLLYLQSKLQATYQPALQLPPGAWTLALVYQGNGHEFDGPGEMSVDTQGNIWITNNYVYSRNPRTCVSGGRELLRLTPTGMDAPGAPYSGGGLFGAGFGITIDPMGKVWVGNFGFQGADNGVDCDPNPPLLSVSEFSPTGAPLSPPAGYTTDISQPQGMASDPQGNIWIANCGSNSVTKYPGGDANHPANIADIGLLRPFGLAVDADGNAWIASSGNHSLVGLDPQGKPLLDSAVDVGALDPLGVAVDAEGNVWVANSGVVSLPCGGSKGGISPPVATPRITEVRRSGSSATATTFTGGGLVVPWGIAVDGDDHIWVANFAGQRLSEFCGAKPETCPRGMTTGDAISPRTGYGFDGLTRNTGVVIDPSGNVWLANNWKTIAVQTNPGGDGMVEFIGLAAPIQTPLIGLPHRP